MEDDYLFESHKRDYFFELEMRDRLLQRFQLFMVVATALSTVIGYLIINRHNYIFQGGALPAYIFLLFLSSCFLVSSFFNFRRGVTGQEYEYLPTPGDIENYVRNVKKHATKNGIDSNHAITDIKNFYYDSYLSGADTNSKLNAQRSKFAHMALNDLFHSAVITGLAFVFLTTFAQPIEDKLLPIDCKVSMEPLEVEISATNNVFNKELLMGKDGNDKENNPGSTSSGSQKPSSPPPQRPKNRLIKEDGQSKEKKNERG